jgi:hypothetical protein
VVIVPITDTDPFASTALMEQRSQGAITLTSHPYLPRELASASQDIKDFCRWHITPRKSVTQKRRGRFAEDVWLQAMQIEKIDAVTIDGVEYTEDQVAAVEFDEETGWTNLRGRMVEVTFTAGFVEVPEPIETATLQIAARALGSPLGVVREQAGGVSVTHSQIGFNIAGGNLILPAEQSSLTPYQIGRLP